MLDSKFIDDEIIEAYFQEYRFVLYRNVKEDIHQIKKIDPEIKDIWDKYKSENTIYCEAMPQIINGVVHPDDREALLHIVEHDNFIKEMQDKKTHTLLYRRKEGNQYVFEKLSIIRLGKSEDVEALLFCCRDVDKETKDQIRADEIKKQNMSLTYALGKEYDSVYYVDITTSEVTPYNLSNRIEGLFGDQFYRYNFEVSVSKYIETAVSDDDKSMMKKVLSKKFIVGQLKNQDRFIWRYKNNEDCYCEMKCVKVNDGPEVQEVVMGFAVKDVEIRVELEEKAQVDFQLSLLDGLSQEYESVWLLKPDKTIRLFRVSDNPIIQSVALQYYDCPDFDIALADFIDKHVVTEDKARAKKEIKYKKIVQKIPTSGVYSITFRRYAPKGESYIQICFSNAIGPDGEENIVFAFRDVDKMIREENKRQELYSEAVRERDMDGLTGIKNRFCYERNLAELNKKNYNCLTCIFIDVDGLHELNYKKGHKEGDELIKFVARTLAATWGRENTYRVGGDEFVVFVFNEDDNRIILEIDSIKRNCHKYNYSISVGYCSAYKENEDIDGLIVEAEKRMYLEKEEHHLSLGIRR